MTLTDIDHALLDPAAAFDSPESVLSRPGVDHETKVAILKRWKQDAEALSVAEDEGMTGEKGSAALLQRIHRALDSLEQGTRDSKQPHHGKADS